MDLELTKEQRREALDSIEQYFREELEQPEVGELQAGLLLDYFLKELGPLAYNRGVADAQRYFIAKTEDLTGVIFAEEFGYWIGRKRRGPSEA